MIKIFVDSCSSIKREEQESYGVEILPLKVLLGDKEYLDGVDLPLDVFYSAIIEKKIVPKTSLPSLDDAERRVNAYTGIGYDVLILTMSSGVSGTYSALSSLFRGRKEVRVVDSKTAVGGIRLLLEEANRYIHEPLDVVVEKINALIPRIKVLAVPENLTYLHRGGRLSTVGWAIGTALHIKPVVTLDYTVKVSSKAIGLKAAMRILTNALLRSDERYPIIPSYTYDKKNLETLIAMSKEDVRERMAKYDHIDAVIAAHWGPNAFGYIFVEKEN